MRYHEYKMHNIKTAAHQAMQLRAAYVHDNVMSSRSSTTPLPFTKTDFTRPAYHDSTPATWNYLTSLKNQSTTTPATP